MARVESGRLGDAEVAFRKVVSLQPESAESWSNLGASLLESGRTNDGLDALERAGALDPDSCVVASNRLFYAVCSPARSPDELLALHRDWGERVGRRLGECAPNGPAPRSVALRPLRVGYVSGDFREHPVATFFAPVLEAHDRASFHVTCYVAAASRDETTQRLRRCADAWRDISVLSDADAAALVRRDEIDILVDLSGHTARGRLGIFVRKPAPIQLSYLGYPCTTGLRTIDYRITDALADPPGQTERWHVERLLRPFASFLCYRPPRGCPAVAAQPSTASGHVTFGSFNHIRKLNGPTVRAWSRVLLASPGSRIALKCSSLDDPACAARIVDGFHAHGVAADRIEVLAFERTAAGHLASYARVDIALDTFPYNGTTTICEALWMGVPVVSRAGDDHRSRVGLSILTNAGLADLVASSEDEFVRIACGLAAAVERRAALRSDLRARLEGSPLTDAGGFTRALERAYRAIVSRPVD